MEEIQEENRENVEQEVVLDELYEHKRIVIDPKQTPTRIDKFLLDRLFQVSRNRIQNALHTGSIKVNDKMVKPNFKIKPGHVITIVLPTPPKEDGPIVPNDIPLDIRYEDDSLLIVHKSPGMVVHPGVGNPDHTLVNALAHYYQISKFPVMEGNLSNRPGLVHRIDKDTSGLMVIAKTEQAMTHLAKQFFDHTVERTYQALIWGEPHETEGTVDANIARDTKFTLYKVYDDPEIGKHAVTHYKVLERLYYISVVECQLETGRTHQIRVHMKYKGHPIFNDEKYGGNRVVKGTVFDKYRRFVENSFKLIPRQALHAKSLGFVHPRTGEKMYFESEMPEDFQAVMTRWRTYLGGRKELL